MASHEARWDIDTLEKGIILHSQIVLIFGLMRDGILQNTWSN